MAAEGTIMGGRAPPKCSGLSFSSAFTDDGVLELSAENGLSAGGRVGGVADDAASDVLPIVAVTLLSRSFSL